MTDWGARLEEVLNAPLAPGPSRHARVVELAQRYVAERPSGVEMLRTKELAVAETAPAGELTGAFIALVSDFDVDRTNERFMPGAWDEALAKIRRSGKATPVLFGHAAGDLHAVLGMVPADGWRVDERGLWAEGWLDVSDPVGQKIHRMLRSGALQWSIGFTATRSSPDSSGVRVLERVGELLEVSVTPLPANGRTRTVSAKSDVVPSLDELRERERRLDLDPEITKLRARVRRELLAALSGAGDTDGRRPSSASARALRRKCRRVEHECVLAELGPVSSAPEPAQP